MKVGLLFGKFDPPHLAHLKIAHLALESGKVDSVWMTPDFDGDLTNYTHRCCMLSKMLMFEHHIFTCMEEKSVLVPENILNTMSCMLTKYPENEFSIIIGTDNWWNKGKLNHLKSLEGYQPFIWVDRPGQSRTPKETLFCNLDHSSTHVRKLLFKNKDVSEFLHKDVIEYIKKESLYTKD